MVFDAIMIEGSITRAANRLAMTQPAVSNAVARMRSVWNDELFVKDGRNIQPTVYAQNLWNQVHDSLRHLEQAVSPDSFDPATAKRTFRVAVTDALVEIVWPSLRQLIEAQAPGINIHARPYTITNTEQILMDAEVDLVVGINPPSSSVIRTSMAMQSKFVCIMRNNHPLAKANLSIEEFANADHLLVSLSGDIEGLVDQALQQQGLKRRVAMTVNHFSVVPPLLQQSDLIAVLPSTTVEKAIFDRSISVTRMPIMLEPPPLLIYWHKRNDNDEGLRWLREHIFRLIHEHSQNHRRRLENCYCVCPEEAAASGLCPDLNDAQQTT